MLRLIMSLGVEPGALAFQKPWRYCLTPQEPLCAQGVQGMFAEQATFRPWIFAKGLRKGLQTRLWALMALRGGLPI